MVSSLHPHILSGLAQLGLLTPREVDALRSLHNDDFMFRDVLARAETVHVHIRVEDVSSLPHEAICGLHADSRVENRRDGYVKYAFGGTNVIFSAIDVAEDDRLPGPRRARPHLDHVGLDLRRVDVETRAMFDAAPARARPLGWRWVAQGGAGRAVFCCHTSVAEKHWLYPNVGDPFPFPIELAFGPLEIHAGKMGCDLRPIDPAHPQAASVVCGGDTHGSHGHPSPGEASSSYYERADLGRFGEVGSFAKDTWSAFMTYYTKATSTDSALTRRDKSLIALAVAHSKQCPYCIDSYTKTCLEAGATVEQMHEAVHVAAAMSAAIDLVHATQMHGALRRHGAI